VRPHPKGERRSEEEFSHRVIFEKKSSFTDSEIMDAQKPADI